MLRQVSEISGPDETEPPDDMPADGDEHVDLDTRLREASRDISRWVTGGRRSLAEELEDLAAYARGLTGADGEWDLYGERGPVAALERRVCDLLRLEDAAFFPSGTMAQQAALRTWCDRAGSARVALPDLSHLLVHELDGPRALHRFDVIHLTTGPVTPRAEHLNAVPGQLGAVLIELPLRDAGHLLPTWEELVELSKACRLRGVALHLDGARLWESAPWFGHDLAEIAGLADSVYVSFYKGLGGLAGAALAGPNDFVAEAKLWRKRSGGTLFTLAPYALSGLRGLERTLPLMEEMHEHAVAVAQKLTERGAQTTPPQSVAFRVYVPGDAVAIKEVVVQIAETQHIGIPARWSAADVPGWAWAEITVNEATLGWTPQEAADAILTPWALAALRLDPVVEPKPQAPWTRLHANAGAHSGERTALLCRAAAVLGLNFDDLLRARISVGAALTTSDPIGLMASGAPEDEYDLAAETIALRLVGAGSADASHIARVELCWWFGPDLPAGTKDDPKLGRAIWAAWESADIEGQLFSSRGDSGGDSRGEMRQPQR